MAVRTRLTARQGRRFAFTVGIAFLVFGAISVWRGHELPPRVLWTLGSGLLLSGIFIPSRLGRVYGAWMAFGHAISRVTAPIVVGAMYFLVLSPIGIVIRLFGRNPLHHRGRNGGFWLPVRSDGRSDLDTQF